MSKEELIGRILSATPAQVDAAAAALSGQAMPTDTRLLTFSAFADAAGVSRQTIHRMVKLGRLAAVETVGTRRRIPASELARLQKGGK